MTIRQFVPSRPRVRLLAAAWLFALVALGAAARAGDGVSFTRDVRPILANHCFKCHGPDDAARQAGLRLDRREAATAEAESGATPIVPGKPEESELVRRIVSSDAEARMPPAAANKPLSPQQMATLKAWIAAGAPYEAHWAFVPPRQAALPAVRDAAWPRNPIDHFVLSRLDTAGLRPSPEADKHTLVRRLHLDLIGLPPTPEEVNAFVADASPQAYEVLVDRLLASPHYGERWARRWLDLARYADTNGYEKDRVRSIWPYRDWVIAALGADMPFDQFTIEQLAGDMLPGATVDQRIATGFHRNTMLNEEGGVDPLEFRFHAMVDRVSTTGTVWLGLTVGCAQCHTHKYDPIPQRDYYRLMAFLNNADEPEMDVPRPDIAERRAEIEAHIAAIEADLPNRFPLKGEYRWHDAALVSVTSAGGAEAEVQDDGTIRVSGAAPEKDTYTLVLDSDVRNVSAVRLEALTDPKLPKKGPGRTPHGNFVLTEIAVVAAPSEESEHQQPVAIASAVADFSQEGFPPERAFDGDDKTGWAIQGPEPWNVDRSATFRFREPWTAAGRSRWTIRLAQDYGGGHTMGRLRLQLGERIEDDRPEGVRRQDHLTRQFNAWLAKESARAVPWTLLKPVTAASSIPTLAILEDGSVLASGDQSKSDLYRITLASELPRIAALRLEVLPDDSLPKRGPGRIAYEGPFGDFFLSELAVRAGGERVALKDASHSRAGGEDAAARAIDGDPQTGWMLGGGQGQAHEAVFSLAAPLADAKTINLELLFERYYAAGLGRFRVWATDDPRPVTARAIESDVQALLARPEAERTAADRDRLMAYYLSIAPELAGERDAIRKLRESMPAYPTTLVMAERRAENRRGTHVHKRGEFLQPTDPIEPELAELFAPLGPDEPHDRLAFARWLASERNPLVGRVTVNRHWAALFGRGLVRTTEDFGYQGEPPTHPELLDWLAVEFMRHGWSVKKLHKLIVTSATYRQSSRVTPELLEKDPQNKLLARAPRVRLDAELVRDAVLRASGLLSEKIGGPSVFPPQPASVTSEGAYGGLAWKVSEGPDRYRRGLYTFSKRTAPFAMFIAFDAASGEACLARREVSNTPLQSLTLLNDSAFVEAAQALGKLLAAKATPESERLDELFLRCVSRPPCDVERATLLAFHQANQERLAKHELDAAAIAGGGEEDALPRAAWTLTARAVLNLDEAITKE
ncbi:MAG: PSD1 domain-containing protein [Planctomycetia bacterium]|nr:PSD1 domain-containing protein [Planctomycetia bacterium]